MYSYSKSFLFPAGPRTALRAFSVLATVAASLAVSAATRANLNIVPTFDSTITSDPNAATIESAIDQTIARVDSDIANNVTVNITFSEMSTGLGESSTSSYTVSYATYVNALETQQTLSVNDVTAIASLGFVPGTTTTNPVNGSSTISVGTALARTLGIVNSSGSDGTIGLNTSIMNLSRTGTQNAGFYDLQAVAGHEIDEVLGIGGAGSTLQLTGSYTGQAPPTGNIGTLDLYRYSALNVRSYSLNPNVAAPYFSINGGATKLVNFNQNGANGADFGDWGNGGTGTADMSGNTPAQLQDAFGTPGTDVNIGTNELTALDVIGYNLATPVPEPGTVALFAVGAVGMVGFAVRRRAQRNACL